MGTGVNGEVSNLGMFEWDSKYSALVEKKDFV